MNIRDADGTRVGGAAFGVQGAGGVKLYDSDGTRIDIPGGGGGTDVALDLGDTGTPQSLAINEIATIYDRFGVATEPSNDKLLLNFAALEDRYTLGPPTSPGTPNDEFTAGTLAGKWTVVTGASGTIDPYDTSTTTAVYDLALRSSVLSMQAGRNSGTNVAIRQDYTLPDGSGIYAALYPGVTFNSVNNTSQTSLVLNSSNTSPDTGTFLRLQVDKNSAPDFRMLLYDGADIAAVDVACPGHVWMAITRRTLTYYGWISLNGGSNWISLGSDTVGAEFTDLWIYTFAGAALTAGQPIPVHGYDWIRLGSDDPYNPGW